MSGVPGSTAQIHAAAGAWGAAGERLHHSVSTLRKADPEDWLGTAATTFREAQSVLIEDLVTSADRVASASRVLASYAAFLSGLEAKSTELHHSRTNVEARIAKNPFDALALLDIVSLGLAEHSLLRRAQSAADEAARQLLALIESEVGGTQHWWDPLGIWDDDSKPDESVNEHTLDDTNWDPAYVSQGSIGDCYAVSTIMGYMSTEEGQELLKQNIRWDDDKNGYLVTLYENGKPKEYLVDKVYEQGVDQVDGHTLWLWTNTSHNVVSLYEAALAQATSYDDINDGGTAVSAIEAITGRPATFVDFNHDGFDNSLDQMSNALDAGSPVIATVGPPHGTIPLEDVTILRPNGKTEVADVDIVRNHAYEVERVESDGSVWVRNPHGPDNAADGGGLIHLTRDQFSRCFTQANFEETS